MNTKVILLSTALAAGSFSAALAQENTDADCDPATESCAQLEDQMEPSAEGGTPAVTEGSQGQGTGDSDASPEDDTAPAAGGDDASTGDSDTSGDDASGSTAGGTDASTGDSDTSGDN
jgi:hypothetical protein